MASTTGVPGAAAAPRHSPLRYTRDNARLTFEQRKFYEHHGYLVLRGLVGGDVLDECGRRLAELCGGRVPPGPRLADVSPALCGECPNGRPQDWDDVLARYLRAPEVLDVVECFTGPNIVAVNTVLVSKPPDAGRLTSRHPLHQDLHFFPFRPADRIVAAWTALEDVHEDDCLFAVPGSHRAGRLYQHDYPDWVGGVSKAFRGVRGFSDLPRKMLTMAKGDTVFYHPLLVHGSNQTNGSRKAISGHFAASECYCVDVRGTAQDGIAKEAVEEARNRNISFQDAWRMRSRCVRGEESTLSLEPTLRSRY